MTRPYTHADFARLVLAEFPELRAEFEEDAGLLHLQMAAFARRTGQAVAAGDWAAFDRGVRLADALWSRPDPGLENALNVSYFEHLDFEGPCGQAAWARLTPGLRHGWREMQAHLDELARRAQEHDAASHAPGA